MKKIIIALCSLLLAFADTQLDATPIGTAFTYQGRLMDGANPANGIHYMLFTLHDALEGGHPIASQPTNTVFVSNGLFTVDLDFGASAFTGSARWLTINVRTNGGVGVDLSPRTRLAPTPHALYASTAGVAGTVTNGAIQFSQLGTPGTPAEGQVLGYNGSSLVWKDPATPGSAWAMGGNEAASSNFLGTLNNQPLDLKVHGTRALRLEPNTSGAPNVIGGSIRNYVSSGVVGGTIAGGGAMNFYVTSESFTNSVTANFATVGGGAANTSRGDNSTTGGGYRNSSLGVGATIGGGTGNTVQTNGAYSTISGGLNNSTESNAAFVGGGTYNHANGSSSTLAGGYDNTVSGGVAFIGGGARNRANTSFSTIAGGENNTVDADYSTVGGGSRNTASGPWSTVGGGIGNRAAGYYATVPGGVGNQAAADFSFAAGTSARANHPGSFVWADSYLGPVPHPADVPFPSIRNDEFAVRANGGVRFVTPSLTVSGTTTTGILTITGGSDLAEPFQMSTPEIPEGAVVVIDDENAGKLKLSDRAYDHRVAGIVSGANGINPGIALHQEGALEGGKNVALTGRVYVQADATSNPIKPGDLLTTSNTPGHAMRVADHANGQGAIIGKAMSALNQGKGMVLVLVSLQ